MKCLAAALLLLLALTSAQGSTLHGVVHLEADGSRLLPDSLRQQTHAGERYSVTRMSCLLSGFALQRADGTWLDLPATVAWLDAAQRHTQFTLSGVPAARYQGLRFYVGLDAATNAAPPANYGPSHPLNPNVNGLHWSWQGGYIFLALEGSWKDARGATQGYSYHFARHENRTAIVLTGEVDLSGDATLEMGFDVSKLITGKQALAFGRDGVSTHSQAGDPLAAALAANLPGSFSFQKATSHVPEIARPSAIQPVDMPAKFTPYAFKMGSQFPIPPLPRDNPLIEERVRLGERLFHEPLLSRDGSLSCASCHQREHAFSDPHRLSAGVEGRQGTRHSMPLFNLAWKSRFFWDGRAASLREQVLIPIQDHLEMDEDLARVVQKLQPTVGAAFAEAFSSQEVTAKRIGLALESYLLTLTAHDSKFDRAMRGEAQLTEEEQRGFELFMTEREPRMGSHGADCFHCHGGALFTDHQFRNNGLAISAQDTGRARVTLSALDRGTFSTPSLRNVAVTAPYMHDGRFSTLEQVLDHYSEGVERTDTLDPNLAKHPDGGLHLSAAEKQAVIAFLRTLTDHAYTTTP